MVLGIYNIIIRYINLNLFKIRNQEKKSLNGRDYICFELGITNLPVCSRGRSLYLICFYHVNSSVGDIYATSINEAVVINKVLVTPATHSSLANATNDQYWA